MQIGLKTYNVQLLITYRGYYYSCVEFQVLYEIDNVAVGPQNITMRHESAIVVHTSMMRLHI